MRNFLQAVSFWMFIITMCKAQQPINLIKYDLKTHSTDKVIPFDQKFTLSLEKFNGENVTDVHLYEAHLENGNRFLVRNIVSNTKGLYDGCCRVDKGQKMRGSQTAKAILDKALGFRGDTSSLTIYVDPLKPNKMFDINVIGLLSAQNKTIAYEINSFLAPGGDYGRATALFNRLDKALTDPFIFRSYLTLSFSDYQTFYDADMKSAYVFLSTSSHFPVMPFITLEELQAIDISLNKEKQNYKEARYLVEVILNGLQDDVQRGLIDITQIFKKDEKTELAFGHKRILYFQSSLSILDSLHHKLNWLIGKGYDNVTINGTTTDMHDVRKNVQILRENMSDNLKKVSEKMNLVSRKIDDNTAIRQGVYLAGNTISSDLKTAGGSVLFVDVGFSNLLAPGLKDSHVYIPRLYTGVSIYFRPIDKNSRNNNFPKKFSPNKNCGCNVDGTCGPDYGVISRTSVWQHLCLNIGLTLGTIPNKDFENLYNNTSLLIGPGYRFKRAFKVSAGFSFLKRSSENPVISEKNVVVGQYISLSVDIDFVQSIKDVTSILFK